MDRTAVLILAGVVSFVTLIAFLVLQTLGEQRQRRLSRRLNGHDEDANLDVPAADPEVLAARLRERRSDFFTRMIEDSDLNLEPAQAQALTFLVAILLGTGLYLWREQVWLGLVGVLAGIGGMLWFFHIFETRYRRKLQNQLPDALFLLARALRAGLSLEQALTLVGEQGARPLSKEFQKAATRIRLGLTIPVALQLMADRIRLVDFNAFVSTVSLYQKTGGNLPLLIDRLAAGTRDHNQFRGHFRSITALGRITSLVLATAVPLILLVYALAQPEYVQAFFQSTSGWIVVGVALALELIGVVWIYNIMRIEY